MMMTLLFATHLTLASALTVEPDAPKTPTYVITPSADGTWRTVEAGPTTRLSVGTGRFELHVDKVKAENRFLLTLPDGELEVRGTRFVVEVDASGTKSVSVTEGRVELRLQGKDIVELPAGHSWDRTTASASNDNTSLQLIVAPNGSTITKIIVTCGGNPLRPPALGKAFIASASPRTCRCRSRAASNGPGLCLPTTRTTTTRRFPRAGAALSATRSTRPYALSRAATRGSQRPASSPALGSHV